MVDISVGRTTPVQTSTAQTADIGASQIPTGAGVVGQGGAIPDPITQNYELISQSLSKHFPSLTGDEVDTLIAQITMKLKEVVGETGTNELNAKEEQKRQSQAERREAAIESQEKLDEAKAAREKQSKSSGFGKFFNALIAVASIVAGAILIATGVGAIAGAALIVAGTAAAVQLADQILMEETGFGIAGNISIAKQMADGVPREQAEEKARQADKNFGIVVMVVMITASVVSMRPDLMLKSAGTMLAKAGTSMMSQLGSTTAQVGTQAAKGADMAAKAAKAAEQANTMSRFGQMAQHGANGINAAATAGSASSQIASAKFSYDAAHKTADSNRLQAKAADLQALNEALNDAIDEIMTRISGANSIFNAMLEYVTSSINDRGDTFARARFSG